MSLKVDFKPDDLIYGFREDLEAYITNLKGIYPRIKFFSQSHVNKDLVVQNSEHMVSIRHPSSKNKQKDYGTIAKQKTDYRDESRPQDFFYFLAFNYAKYNLAESTGQCLLFKRLCKQGIQYTKTKDLKIHFVLDTIYDVPDRQLSIIQKKGIDDGCECNIGSVTGSELRSIYRDWKNLKNTVTFWYHDQKVPAPWNDPIHKNLWEQYQPASFKLKNKLAKLKLQDSEQGKSAKAMN